MSKWGGWLVGVYYRLQSSHTLGPAESTPGKDEERGQSGGERKSKQVVNRL